MGLRSRILAVAFPAILLSYLLFWAGRGLAASFFPDDMMNLYHAWDKPVWRLFLDLLSVWNNDYRALGAILYRILYELFGLQPLPYRVLCFGLLILNVWLVYRLAFALSRNEYGAWGAALVFAYHPYFSDVYMSTATIYDLACFATFWGAVLVYHQRPLHWGVVGLGLLAMGAKEIAVSLPVLLLGVDVVLGRRPAWKIVGGVTAISLTMAAAKVAAMGRGTVVGEYVPELSIGALMKGWEHYWGMLLYERWSQPMVVNGIVLAGLVGIVLLKRAGWARLAAFAFLVIPLPVLLIAPRSFYVYYLPYAAWAMLWGSLAGRFRTPGLALALVILSLLNWRHRPWAEEWIARDNWKVARMVEEFGRLKPIRAGERILVVDDSIPSDDWILLTTLRLACRDRELQVWRVRQLGQPEEKQWDRRVDFRDWRLREIGN